MASIEHEDGDDKHDSEIDSLMGATLEIEKMVQQPLRAIDPFKRKEREQGILLISKFRVGPLPELSLNCLETEENHEVDICQLFLSDLQKLLLELEGEEL